MSVRVIIGDALEQLRLLPDESVNCCVTSPPYYGLRDYGTAQWDGGDDGCRHLMPATGASQNKGNNGKFGAPYRDECGHCGARRIDRQIGLEASPDEYIATLVEVFREVRRVLRADGTLWLNIGDSYAGSWGNQGRKNERGSQRPINGPMLQSFNGYPQQRGTGSVSRFPGCKPKDLIGIPWMLAFALRADGWWLRQDIIWSKPNPMLESVADRCTKAHEYLFLLSKSERYFYDATAIAEKTKFPDGSWGRSKCYDDDQTGRLRSFYGNGSQWQGGETRNKRSVWEVATQPFSEAHFATFPPSLIEPCILAGCPKGGTVLDPFGGAGTTGLVADRLGRDAVLIELNPAYAGMARQRIQNDAPLLVAVT